jgi:hypothetical protein
LVWFGRVAVVNQLARQLLHVEHPNSEEIVSRQNQLNSKWSLLREKSELKREELISAHGVQVSIQSSFFPSDEPGFNNIYLDLDFRSCMTVPDFETRTIVKLSILLIWILVG